MKEKKKEEKEEKEEVKEELQKDFVIQLNGGIGKSIMATSFVKWLKKKYPKQNISVISPWPEIFEYNPNIYRNLPIHQAYIYEDYIKGRDYRTGDPYQQIEYYREENKKHLMNVFPKSYGFNELNENPENEVYLTTGEQNDSEMFKLQGPPVFTIQFTGGIPQGAQVSPNKGDMAQRDMGVMMGQTIVNILLGKGFRVVQVCQGNEPKLKGAITFNLPFRRFACLAPIIAGHIGIDSSMMHACSAFKTPQMIFWGQTHKDNLGYKYNGFFDKHKKDAMYCRPHCAMPDNGGVYSYKDSKEAKAMDWKPEEIKEAVEEFVEWVTKNRIPGLYPQKNSVKQIQQ
jgi:hypothetical protein